MHARVQTGRASSGSKINTLRAALLAGALIAAPFAPVAAQAQVPTPASVLGFNPGDDYKLASYEDSVGYFQKLAASSNRVKLFTAGKTTRGREMIYAVISSPENIARFDEYKEVHRKLADSRGLTDEQARELAHKSKIIVHIDGGMHSSEAADHQLPIALAYKLAAAKDDREVDAILDNVILVLWPTLNPDGQTMITEWYRQNVGTKYEVAPMPWLYQDYVGHDNNRDGYMLNMTESQVVAKAQQDYSPAIFYSQHQKAPFPARIWMPPFADPISSNISPLMRTWTNVVGTNMMAAFENQGLPGAIAQARFDNWYPGFLDYTHVFRHSISFFTETALHEYATPKFYEVKDFPKDMQDLKGQVMYPSPWKGGWWRLGDAVKYMEVASMSVLDTAAKYREQMLYNRYQSARDTIKLYSEEGPRAYVIPAAQADTPEAGLLAQKMIDNGLEVHVAKRPLTVGATTYPAGSWVILMDQPFARLAKELFEIQKYPDAVMAGVGKEVTLPYDSTGWTLPMQMGVKVDEVGAPLTDAQKGLLAKVDKVVVPGGVTGSGSVFLLDRKVNASFEGLNEALAAGGKAAFSGGPDGAIVVTGLDRRTMTTIAGKHGLQVRAVSRAPVGVAVAKARIGLYRPWRASMDEGWTRWVLEQYGYGLTSLYNADVQAGNLAERFDTIVIPDMNAATITEGLKADAVPEQYAGGIGDQGIAALNAFVAAGGTLVTLNEASGAMIDLMDLPVTNVLKDAKSDTFFASGALVEVELNSARPAVQGLPSKPIVMFTRGPAFTPKPGMKGAVLASYAAAANPLRSGVLFHPEAIQGKAAAMEVEYGKGRVFLYGFRPQWRGQSHGGYKFLFNTLYRYEQPALSAAQTAVSTAGAKPAV